MNRAMKSCLMLCLAFAIVLPLTAQEKEKKKKKGKDRPSPIQSIVYQTEKANLTAEQSAKIKDLAAEAQKKVDMAQEKLGDKQQQIASAKKKASTEGKKGKELRDAVKASVDLSEEEEAAMQALERTVTEFRQAVVGLLTPEQREAANLREGKKKGKKNQ